MKSIEIHEIKWNLMKTNAMHEIQWNSSCLGSSKGFFRGGHSSAFAVWPHQSHEIHWNPRTQQIIWKLMKFMQIDEITASWDRAKISWGVELRRHSAVDPGAMKSMNIYEILWNLMKTFEIHKNRWNSSRLGSSKGFSRGRTPSAFCIWPQSHETLKIHKISRLQ